MHHMWDAVRGDFEWNRDLLLDLFCRNSRPLSNDLNVVVGYVGISLNGQALERKNPSGEKYQRQSQDEQTIVKSKINDSANHSLLQRVLQRKSIRDHLI